MESFDPYALAERAAILEYDAELSREEAEEMARWCAKRFEGYGAEGEIE